MGAVDFCLEKKGEINRLLSEMSLVLLCVIMFYSMHIFVFWGKTYVVYLAISIFVSIRMRFVTHKISKSDLVSCFFCLVMYSVLDLFHLENITSLFSYALRHVFLVCFVLLLKDTEKKRLVLLFTRIFVIIVGISLISFILYLLGVELPYETIRYDGNTNYSDFKCYPFLLIENEPGTIVRFQSVFLEPGHLGMISALLLYINGYSLKQPRVFVLLLSIFASLSLAAYVLLVIGAILYYIMNSKRVLKRVVLSFAYLLLIVVVGVSYYIYDPNSIFSRLIVERLDYNEDKGLRGNNRTSASFDSYYEQQFYKGGDCLLGVGPKIFSQSSWGDNRGQGGNASYKVFIVKYGLFGIFVLLLFFSVYTYYHKSKLLFGLLLLYIISFWQRPYALWEVELFLFIGAAIFLDESVYKHKGFVCVDRY